jgi:peptidoglycan/xylan/chitin deacetylase (PgdA/CDA1 family)
MKWLACILCGSILVLSGCDAPVLAAPMPTRTALPFTQTSTVTLTPTTAPTLTASPVPTATRVSQGPDAVTVPILLYHRIDTSPINSRYYVTPENFAAQMQLLADWEYETIPTELLVRAITEGAPLPPRPVIITFDDGHIDNYATAWPIMQEHGFTGILYVVAGYIGADEYMDAGQIVEMQQAGWEIGNHSMTHRDLTVLEAPLQRDEIVNSRRRLEAELGVPILTFAYPFGALNGATVDYAHFAGYIAAMNATGYTADQGSSNLFALQRVEVKGQDDVKSFTRFLPWHGNARFLPTATATITPRPTRTPIPTYTQYPTRTKAP